MDNYDFCAAFTLDLVGPAARVLDFGCGNGRIVSLLRERRMDAFGCDIFYQGGDASHAVDPALFAIGAVREMLDGRIPFPDEHFDLVISNQVFEHVPDLAFALAEIARVLRPGGRLLALFPDANTWREVHCGVPFLHWFPKESYPRVLYAAAIRALGVGHFKSNKKIMQWSRDFCAWLDEWTHYRTERNLQQLLGIHFNSLRHHEADWIDRRFGTRLHGIPRALPTPLKTFIVRKWAGQVVTCIRANPSGVTPSREPAPAPPPAGPTGSAPPAARTGP